MKGTVSIMSTHSPTISRTSQPGFISLYFLSLLAVCVAMSGYISTSIRQYIGFQDQLSAFRTLNNAEVLVIERLKYMYRNYKEKDENFIYNDVAVSIEIHGRRAEITLELDDLCRQRTFRYDPVTDTVDKYY